MDPKRDRQVLASNVKPSHYDLTVEPDFESFIYEGTVVIELTVLQRSSSIELNAKSLEVYDPKVEIDGSTLTSSLDVQYHAADERIIIHLGGTTIEVGQAVGLTLSFRGKLDDSMTGFYRASWKGADGNKHWLAATQLAPVDARKAFPCFDEPALKATFTVTLVADPSMICLANMNVASQVGVESNGKPRQSVTFARTPAMSTYLVAFIVGDFKVVQSDRSRVPVRVYCTPDQDEHHANYAADLAARTLEFYEQRFDIPYPLPKMDMVAIPDFPMRAMENWGLITYSCACLLLDEAKTSAANLQAVTENVQHELSHQWFGNLVTMEFWDGLWLNEGFARWMAWYACNYFHPEWKVWDSYVTTTLRMALAADGLRSSHPVEVPVRVANEINQIFDDISYEKGSAVLRMISKYIGEDVFMDGLRSYLTKYAYGSTTTDDLWRSLGEASGKDVERFADIWARKVGYPVVSVTEDANLRQIHVRQNRFLVSGDVASDEDEVVYPILLGLLTSRGVEGGRAFYTRQESLPLPEDDFFKLNAEHSGLYRTLYASDRLEKLGQSAKEGRLPVSDRIGLISDAAALAEAGYQKTSSLLGLLQTFGGEPDSEVWFEINTCMRSLKAACIFEEEQLIAGLESFHRSLVGPKLGQLGWDISPDDGHVMQRFKAQMFTAACNAGDQLAVSAAHDMFAKFTAGQRDALQPNLRRAVYRAVLRHGGQAEYDALISEYKTSTVPDEKEDVLECLGVTRNMELLQQTLGMLLSDDFNILDIFSTMQGFKEHKAGVVALWEWLRCSWDALYEIGRGVAGFGTLVSVVLTPFTKDHQREMVQEFFKDKDTKAIDMSLAQALDMIKSKDGWLSRDKKDIQDWLNSHEYLQREP